MLSFLLNRIGFCPGADLTLAEIFPDWFCLLFKELFCGSNPGGALEAAPILTLLSMELIFLIYPKVFTL